MMTLKKQFVTLTSFRSFRSFWSFSSFVLLSISLFGCRERHPANEEGFDNLDQVLRISSTDDPSNLDPRLARDIPTASVLHMLFEGLMHLDFQGKPVASLAAEVLVSDDKKTYTFKLRESKWSNGEPLTAQHFVDTWKSLLDPTFPAPNAYQFYMIKGAKQAKEGKLSLDQIGVKATDPLTLVVELEAPTPYFLDLVCAHFYFPVHPKSTNDNLISNGPFMLKKWKRQSELTVLKNPQFWDANEVRLDGIVVVILDEHTALRMYENGELEWVGSPMGTLPQDAIHTLKVQKRLHVAAGAGTHWYRLNTTKPPFNNAKMRRAFSWALDRHAIVEHVTQGNQTPAMAIVPPSMGLHPKPYFEDHDVPKAWEAFQEALEEMKISKDDFPSISLCYGSSDRNHKIAQAVQQQWRKALGVEVKLESCESKVLFEKMINQDFQIVAGSWFADFRDPLNFLDIFKSKDNATNNTGWEDAKFRDLLDQSALASDHAQRFALLGQAEALLIDAMPVAPVFFATFNYLKDDDLLGVYFCDLGYLDFRYAFFGE